MKRILLLSLLLLPIVALAQYPTFSNKQKLGVQTTGDGLIFRGTTINNIPNYTPSNVNNAYFHLDTIANKLYLYNDGWQQVYPTPQFDTTTLNVYLKISDTTAMLLPYFRDSDTTSLNLINRFALKLNISDTATMLTPYMKKADTISLSNRINLKLNISDTIILSNRITTNANNIIIINNKLATKLDTIYVKFKNVVTMIENKDTINIGSSLTDGYAINIIGDSVNVDTVILDNRYPDRDSTNELQDITFATTSGIVTISGGKVMNLDTLYSSVIDSVNLLIRDSIAAFTPLTEGYGINIIGDSINVDTTVIFTQSDTITLSNRINTKLNVSDTASLSNRIDLKLNISDTTNMLAPYLREADTINLSNRINTKLDTIYVNYQTNVDVITNKDTINIIPLTEGFGINVIGDSINIDSAVILATQQKQIAYVKNQSGVTMYKGQAVYSSGSSGSNKLVQLASSNTESLSSKTFGVVETDSIPNGGHGYVITFGVLSGFNTNTLDEGFTVYLSNTPGQLTSVKPIAPLNLVTIGICIRQQQNNGSIFVKIQNGFELDELHDVRITTPVDKASIYYNLSENLWRDTTATLLISDTASMLNPYLKKLDTISLSNRIDLRVKYADTTNMLLPYFRTNDTTLLNLNSRLSIKLNLSDTTNMLSKYVNTYSNQIDINGNKTFNNVVTIDSATVTGKLLVNTNISDAVKINSNTNSTNLELMNNNGTVSIKSTNRNMVLQTDTTALMYLNGETNRVGILTMTPEQALEVNGTIRVDSLSNNLTPDKLVGANNANDLTDIKIGNGLSFLNDTLKVADNIINSGDTATLLRKDFLGINTNVLVWTEGNKKLLPYFTQVYRNGQLLKSDSQYTITNDSIVTLEEGSYKLGDNITIIAIDNIVALAGGGGIITLQGDVIGSGTNTITTTIGANKVTNTMLAGSISDSKLNTITTVGKVSNSATTATNLNTNNAIVSRDASGNFNAGTITANTFIGNATSSTTSTSTVNVLNYLNSNELFKFRSTNATNVSGQILVTTPGADFSIARTDAAQTFTGTQTFNSTIIGNISGNAATVTTNANLTGDVTSIGNSTTLSSIGTAGTYRSVTTDIKGRVTAGTNPTTLSGYGITDAVPSNRTITINGTSQDLSINRTFNVGTVTSVSGTGNVSGLTLTGSVTGSGNLTLGGTLSLTSSNVTTALGYTPYNSTNPNGYITSSALSSYLPLTGGTLTGDLYTKYLNTFAKTTYVPFNAGISEQSIFNVGTALRGGTVMVFPDSNLVGSSANIFLANSSVQGVESSAMGSGMRNYAKQGGDTRRNSLAFYTSGIGSQNTNRLFIDFDGNVGINDDTPSFKLDVNGTLGVTGATTLNNGLNITGTTNILNGQPFSTLNIIPAPTIGSTDNTIQTINTTGLSFKIGTTERMKLNSSGLLTVTDAATFNSSAVFNEGSTDSDFRVESDGNANMVYVDASTDRVGIGTNSPTRTLEVNGTVGVSSNVTANSFIKSGGSFTEFLKADGTVDGNDYLTTSAAGSTYYPKSGGTISGAVTLSTTTATPTSLLGKDGSNVVGTVTTVAQTGLMTRGETTATTGSPSATFTVTHGLGFNPTAVLVTSAGIGGGDKIIFEVYIKNSTTFSVQAWNYDGTEASGKTVKIYWLALK